MIVGFNASAAEPVLITEFMADSDGALDDDGDSTDWIELQNTGPTPVNLAGWHLTDQADELSKWTFPEVTLAPGAFLVVYASGKDRAQAGLPLHTNFQLDSDGEYLALIRPETSIAHEYAPMFPAQPPGFSYGITIDVTTEELLTLQQPFRWRVPASSA